MKFRHDFVTNSSSSSFIIKFARIADESKFNKFAEKHDLSFCSADEVGRCFDNGIYDAEGIKKIMDSSGFIGNDFCDVYAKSIVEENPDSRFILVRDNCEAEYDEDGDPIYSYNWFEEEMIHDINNDNGFADIKSSIGEGRDG